MKIALSVLYLLHESIKWVSSSIMFGQNLQKVNEIVGLIRYKSKYCSSMDSFENIFCFISLENVFLAHS